MAEATAVKKERVVTKVALTDGREVEFVGTGRVNKEALIDEAKIQRDGDMLVIQAGAVAIRMDFINGDTRTIQVPLDLLARFTAHGALQKFGDELAAPADKPLSPEDMVVAIDDLADRIAKGAWTMRKEGSGGFSGASVVIQAIMEASGKDIATVKAFLQGKLDAAVAKGEKLSRKDLYDSFRRPETKVGAIVQRLEAEKLAKTAKVDADAELEGLKAA